MDINVIVAIVEGVISLAVGALTFFLRRTITELDKCREDIAKVKEDYITKEDFFREQAKTDRKLDRIMDILLEMKGDKKSE